MQKVLFAGTDVSNIQGFDRLMELVSDAAEYYALTPERANKILKENRDLSVLIMDESFRQLLDLSKINAQVIVTASEFTHSTVLQIYQAGMVALTQGPSYYVDLPALILKALAKPDAPSTPAQSSGGNPKPPEPS